MSSWFPSIFNDNHLPQPSSPTTPSAGVKEDLSTLFRGVTAFLAPPPALDSNMISGVKNDLEELTCATAAELGYDFRNKEDLAEIQGTLKSGLSLLSSKFISNLLQFPRETKDSNDDDDLDEDGAVGVTREVVDFVKNSHKGLRFGLIFLSLFLMVQLRFMPLEYYSEAWCCKRGNKLFMSK